MADRYSYLDTNSWWQKSKRKIRWLCQSAECLETGAWGLFVLAVWRSLASFRRGFIARRIFCALSFIAGTDSIKKQLQAQGVALMDKISVCFIWGFVHFSTIWISLSKNNANCSRFYVGFLRILEEMGVETRTNQYRCKRFTFFTWFNNHLIIKNRRGDGI